MDVVEDCLTKIINSNNFPAKLWRLVNNPVNKAIFWDKDGLVVVIDQNLVEQQLLSSRNSSSASNNADTFQTENFRSFLRNLNLYGFKKSSTYDDVQYRYYYHQNFKRDHPELVASLRRLTVVNKAKLKAGLKVKPWTPRRYSRGCGGGDKDDQTGNHSLPSTPHRKSAHPYCRNKAPAVTADNGTPVPPQFLTCGRGAALSPAVFATDKGIPLTPSQHYTGAASSSNAMPIQQSLLPRSNHGTSMDVVEDCLTKSINSNNFPAKLWRLVNNPVNKAIFWDKDGLVVVIDQNLVEQQLLSPRNSSSASNNADTFQTENFRSFLRNLNLYGFKKSSTYDDVQYRYYYHQNFKRDHPELVASLRRLTVVNKAKLKAGGGCGGGDKDDQIDKGIPLTPSQHYAGAASSSNAMPIQQSLLPRSNHSNPNFTFNAQNQPGYDIPCTSMDVVEDCLTKSINSNNFPAKLWRLVNNPVNKAIFWDKDGLVVVIDQNLVEQQLLSSRNSSSASNNADTFKTENFRSFLRNLNLYGFKKSSTYDDVQYRYYYHQNFKRDHPELVANLRRLTVVNKAKLKAGGGCGGGDKDDQIGNHSLPSTPHRKSAHPYCRNKAPAVTADNGTPVPPQFPTCGRGAALSPTVFATDKGIPLTPSQHYAGAASSSNAMPIQQSLLPRSNHVYEPYHPNLVASQMAGDGLQKGSNPTDSHYQASCPVNVNRNQDSKNKDHQ